MFTTFIISDIWHILVEATVSLFPFLAIVELFIDIAILAMHTSRKKKDESGDTKADADDLIFPITRELLWDPVTAEDGR